MDAIGPEKKGKEKLLNTIYNPEFHFLDLEFQTIKIQSFEQTCPESTARSLNVIFVITAAEAMTE